MTESILTPKTKQLLDQKIRTKKKQFIRFLQSDPNCLSNQQLIVTEKLCKELEIKMERIINNDNKIKKGKTKNNKTIKFDELIFGLNETIKLIEKNQITMIWLENRSLSLNMQNIFKKICSDHNNNIICLCFELNNLKNLFHISSLSIIAFKNSIKTIDSKFNEIYSIIKNEINNKMKINSKKFHEKLEKDQQQPQQQLIDQQLKQEEESKSISITISISYEELIRKHLEEIENKMICKNNNDNNEELFIKLINDKNISDDDDDIDFIDYNNNNNNNSIKIEIQWPDQSHLQQRKETKKRFTEKLFDLDQFNDDNDDEKIKFKSPKQIKCIDEQQQGSKRKRKAEKREKCKKEKLLNKNKFIIKNEN